MRLVPRSLPLSPLVPNPFTAPSEAARAGPPRPRDAMGCAVMGRDGGGEGSEAVDREGREVVDREGSGWKGKGVDREGREADRWADGEVGKQASRWAYGQ